MDLKATYNRIAEDWFDDHNSDTWWQEGTERFLAELPADASILDVGCGAGHKSRYLAGRGFDVTGVDFSEKMIDIARRESPNMSFEVVDAYEIDKYPKAFDAVFAQAVLLHIPKRRIREVLTKLKSRIKPNGFLYIAVKGMRDDDVEELVKKEHDYGYEYERFFSFFSLPELEMYLKELGMEVLWKTSTISGRTEWLQITGRKINA
jgi:SAM-dependent methyltransferase